MYIIYTDYEEFKLFREYQNAYNFAKEMREVKWEIDYHDTHGYFGGVKSPEDIIQKRIQEIESED